MLSLTVKSNAVIVQRVLERVVRKLPFAEDAAEKAVADKVHAASLEYLEKLYWVAKPGLVLTGRGFLGRRSDNTDWTRIGALRAAETVKPLFGDGYLITTESGLASSDILNVAGGGSVTKDPEDYAETIYFSVENPSFMWRKRGYEKVAPTLAQVGKAAFRAELLRND